MRRRTDPASTASMHARCGGWTVAAGVFFLLALALAIYYILVPAQVEFHGDCTDTLLWARASAESGRWLSDTFYYACFLPFGGQYLMLPFYRLFGYTITAHIGGMIVFTLLLAGAALFLFRSLGWRRTQSFTAAGTLMLLLMLSPKSREIYYNHIIYYSLSTLFLFVMTGCALRLERARAQSGRAALLVACFLLALMAAANGLSQLALCLVPLMAAIVLARLIEGRTFRAYFQKDGGLSRDLPLLLVLAAGTIAGLALRFWITRGLEAVYEAEVTGFATPAQWLEHIRLMPHGWRSLFDLDIFLGLPAGVQRGLEWFIAAALPLFSLLTLPAYKSLSREEKFIVAIYWTLLLVSLAAWVFTGMGNAGWRLLPLAVFMLCASAIVFKWLLSRAKKPRLWAWLAAAVTLVYFSAAIFQLPTDRRENVALRRAEFLESCGLSKGYATFWYAQAETMLSGGAVSIEPISLSEQGEPAMLAYQSDPAWYHSPAGERTFLMLETATELCLLPSALRAKAVEELVCEDVTVLVYGEPLFK